MAYTSRYAGPDLTVEEQDVATALSRYTTAGASSGNRPFVQGRTIAWFVPLTSCLSILAARVPLRSTSILMNPRR